MWGWQQEVRTATTKPFFVNAFVVAVLRSGGQSQSYGACVQCTSKSALR